MEGDAGLGKTELLEALSRRAESAGAAIEKMFAELSNVKTDRNLLAGLFVEVAKCLNQDVGPKTMGKTASDTLRDWQAS